MRAERKPPKRGIHTQKVFETMEKRRVRERGKERGAEGKSNGIRVRNVLRESTEIFFFRFPISYCFRAELSKGKVREFLHLWRERENMRGEGLLGRGEFEWLGRERHELREEVQL